MKVRTMNLVRTATVGFVLAAFAGTWGYLQSAGTAGASPASTTSSGSTTSSSVTTTSSSGSTSTSQKAAVPVTRKSRAS
jgi:hypothetical protein